MSCLNVRTVPLGFVFDATICQRRAAALELNSGPRAKTMTWQSAAAKPVLFATDSTHRKNILASRPRLAFSYEMLLSWYAPSTLKAIWTLNFCTVQPTGRMQPPQPF
jgi:hypothetical protein